MSVTPNLDEQLLADVEALLRQRARRQAKYGALSISLVVIALVAGLAIFIFAGSITISDATGIQQQQQQQQQQVPSFEPQFVTEGELFIYTSITRAGSLFILIFLVQILISLFRYNIRLSAHYDACADALRLAKGHNSVTLEQLTSVMMPVIDFGKTALSPTQEAVEIAKAVIGRNGK